MEGLSESPLWQKQFEKHPGPVGNSLLQKYLDRLSDPGYKLPLYLAEFAVHDFNTTQDANSCSTMKPDEFYEKVNVVETLRLNSVGYTTTYLVTFEASRPADQITQTFVTKISLSILDPHQLPTKINFLFVKIKGEECDYEEEDNLSDLGSYEDYSEPDSESDDEEQSKENLPDCNKKDSQDYLDGCDNGEQSQEKSPKFHSKVSEENFKELHEEHFEDKSSEFHKKDSETNLEQFDEKHSKDKFLEVHNKNTKENLFGFDEEDIKKCIYYRPSVTTHFTLLEDKYKAGYKLSKEIESFNNDVAKSDGFEVGYYPHMERARIHGTWIYKFYDIANTPLGTADMKELVCLSQLAICVYNMKEDTYFDNVKVLKTMTYGCPGVRYNITFEASLCGRNAEIFQTRIFTHIPLPYAKIEILFVRVKPKCED